MLVFSGITREIVDGYNQKINPLIRLKTFFFKNTCFGDGNFQTNSHENITLKTLQRLWPVMNLDTNIWPATSKRFDTSALVIKHGVYRTTLLVGYNTLLVTFGFQLILLHLSWSEMEDTRLLTASHLDLFLKKFLTFGKPVSFILFYLYIYLSDSQESANT